MIFGTARGAFIRTRTRTPTPTPAARTPIRIPSSRGERSARRYFPAFFWRRGILQAAYRRIYCLFLALLLDYRGKSKTAAPAILPVKAYYVWTL